MTVTVAAVLASPAFVVEATLSAIEEVARVNHQTPQLAMEAFLLEVPNVLAQVRKLVLAAAEHFANHLNNSQSV